MVAFVLDGRARGPGSRALIDDVARGLAQDGVQTHRIELFPSSSSARRFAHSIHRSGDWVRRDAPHPGEPAPAAWLDVEPSADHIGLLAGDVCRAVEEEGIESLHAIGLGLAGRVACLVHERTGLPYCVTPRWSDFTGAETAHDEFEVVLREARHVVLFDEEMRRAVEAAFPGRTGESPLRMRLLRRGVDLEAFKPLPRPERRSAANRLSRRSELASRLEGIDWERACIVVCVQHDGETDGFEQLLFALPEVLRQKKDVVTLVSAMADAAPAVDGLRAALAAQNPEMLHGVLQENELFQPLVDHLDLLHAEGRAEAWWQQAALLEPERRVRFLGDLGRTEFATLVALADFVVLPGVDPRRSTHVAFEALAGGVLPLVRESTGGAVVARLVAEEISPEIASLCVLRTEAPAVREIEDKLGRMVRLRPELGERLRALAVRKFDGRQTAADLRRLYGERAVAARA